MTITNERVASLVLDFTLYPRASVDEHHVSRLAEALRAGATLPPLVADEESRRVVDGFHRHAAHLRVYGDEATCPVDLRSYDDEAALFLDAVRFNSGHGLRISRLDEAHCIEIARRHGIDDDDLAAVLALTRRKYDELVARRFATSPAGEPVLLKAAQPHLAGTRLTKEQVRGVARSSGMPLRFHVDQVIGALESGIADLSESALFGRLRHLAHLLDSIVGEHVE